ncbi:MFS transporter [Arthrobacter bambusae]|uniref:MFS transporter n=1 Tax=Arthrobacter bambusae TaxID=1338426 RepID=UPI00278A7908|nr:MFS transporter [Arthrobacter bambusae]MDQ0029067.1 putative MFS family arabinose efflux permease [Arthrobacter bambusae]MDQ0098531.1 putative MFS family arabinose efflux permease [Arthrobacter bambusae]
MTEPRSRLMTTLIYAALSSAIVSSLGMLLVPSVSREMDVSVSTAQWMLTVNLLVGAVATPVMGRLSDGPHKKRLLISALAIILIGSITAALAPNFTVFLLGRALQGLTYGIVPVTIALARRYVPAGKVQFSISSLSVTVSTGIGIGYPLTGVIAGLFDFRFAFWFAALFVVTAIIFVLRVVPAGPDEHAPRVPFDYAGAVLLGLGLGTLLLGIGEGANWGWGSLWTLGAFLFAAAVLTTWIRTELGTHHPLINLRVLRNGEVLLANGTAVGLGAAMYIGLSISSLVAQAPTSTGYGIALPIFWAGFVMFPLSVGSFGANRLVRRLARQIRLATLLPIGASMITAAGILLWFAHAELWQILIGMLVFGLGTGSSYAAMPALIARSVAADELGSSVSFNQVLRTVGSSFGTAVSGAVLAANLAPDLHPTGSGISATFAIGAILCLTVFVFLLMHTLLARFRRAADEQHVK